MEEKQKFKHCNTLFANKDFDIELDSGETIHIDKGECAIVDFEGNLKYIKHNVIEELDPELVGEDISADGLANFITYYLGENTQIFATLEQIGVTKETLTEHIFNALMWLGIKDDSTKEEETEKVEEKEE